MINPELSHRIARVSEIMMNNGMTFENKRKLYKILNKINSFDNLPDVYKSMILRAEDDIQKQNSNDFLKAAVQSAFEIALKSGSSSIKLNWNCKDSEKNGTGPGSCKEAFRQVLNYKCEFNGTDWRCPDSVSNDTSNEVHNGKHNTLKGSLTNINDIKKPYLEASGKLFEEWGSGPMLEWDPDNIPDKSDPLYSEYKIEEEKYSKLLKQYESERKKVEELAPPIHNGALWQYHRNSYAFNKPEEMKTEKEKRDTKLLEETLNVVETKLPIVLWRGEHKDKWDQLARSKNLETDEFVSLTEERGIAEQFKDSKGTHLIRWELPPKSHAFPIWNQVGNLENVHEREWVLNKGSKIEVTGKFGNILNVKVIPDNTKQNSIKLNYKCPENSHGPGFSCGGEGPEENEYTPEEHKKALEAEQFVKSKFSSEIEVGDCHFLDVSPSIPIYTKHFRAYIDINPDKLDNPKDMAKLSALDNAEKLCTKYKLDLGEIHLVENRKHGIVGASDPLSDRIIISIGNDMLKDPEKVKQIAIIEEKMGIPYSTIDNNKSFDKVLNDVLVHEVAHNLLLEYEYDNNDFYKMSDKPISVYAMTNPHESFAENFVAKQNGQSLDDYNEQYIANVMTWSKNKKEPEDDE